MNITEIDGVEIMTTYACVKEMEADAFNVYARRPTLSRQRLDQLITEELARTGGKINLTAGLDFSDADDFATCVQQPTYGHVYMFPTLVTLILCVCILLLRWCLKLLWRIVRWIVASKLLRKWGCHILALTVAAAAVGTMMVLQSRWMMTIDPTNCKHCRPTVDWGTATQDISPELQTQFDRDGVVLLPNMLPPELVAALSQEADSMPATALSALFGATLRYRKIEHRLDTRNALFHDWAIHGPFGRWAAQLMQTESVRLYNTELLFAEGGECGSAWHRDLVAAPFEERFKSATFNIYFDDMTADSDALIFETGSHSSMGAASGIYEPAISVGDVLVHDARTNHTPSGRGCWPRRSVQLRYVDGSATYAFDEDRLPGVWTLIHHGGRVLHGLQKGQPLASSWYPQAWPAVLPHEQEVVQMGSVFSVLPAFKNGLSKKRQQQPEFMGLAGRNHELWARNVNLSVGGFPLDDPRNSMLAAFE
jgi:hypothetical protein